MHEFIHFVEHALGFCGERHLSLIAILSEWPNFTYTFSYIKTLFK